MFKLLVRNHRKRPTNQKFKGKYEKSSQNILKNIMKINLCIVYQFLPHQHDLMYRVINKPCYLLLVEIQGEIVSSI